ncbi:MAG: hydrolase [Rhodocyclaceae bacterium]|nr:hydrolase [Azospira sp.]HNN45682.1 hydrolase [Azospira sp.]
MLIDRHQSLLLIVDIQEKLAPAIHEGAAAIANNQRLLAAADRLGVPIVVSEQYVRGLGPTVQDLQPLPPRAQRFEKMHFSCAREPGFLDLIADSGRRRIIVTGMEAHVCVLQTVLGLLDAGYAVCLVEDATSSRTPANRAAAISRMREAGADIVTTEMVLFEWLARAGTDEFRTLLPLIK